jgi:hypothetical protein
MRQRRLIRFTTCCGSGCLPGWGSRSEVFRNILKQISLPSLFPKLNEVPAKIAQLLKKRVYSRLVDQLKLVGSDINLAHELNSFLDHYTSRKKWIAFRVLREICWRSALSPWHLVLLFLLQLYGLRGLNQLGLSGRSTEPWKSTAPMDNNRFVSTCGSKFDRLNDRSQHGID